MDDVLSPTSASLWAPSAHWRVLKRAHDDGVHVLELAPVHGVFAQWKAELLVQGLADHVAQRVDRVHFTEEIDLVWWISASERLVICRVCVVVDARDLPAPALLDEGTVQYLAYQLIDDPAFHLPKAISHLLAGLFVFPNPSALLYCVHGFVRLIGASPAVARERGRVSVASDCTLSAPCLHSSLITSPILVLICIEFTRYRA